MIESIQFGMSAIGERYLLVKAAAKKKKSNHLALRIYYDVDEGLTLSPESSEAYLVEKLFPETLEELTHKIMHPLFAPILIPACYNSENMAIHNFVDGVSFGPCIERIDPTWICLLGGYDFSADCIIECSSQHIYLPGQKNPVEPSSYFNGNMRDFIGTFQYMAFVITTSCLANGSEMWSWANEVIDDYLMQKEGNIFFENFIQVPDFRQFRFYMADGPEPFLEAAYIWAAMIERSCNPEEIPIMSQPDWKLLDSIFPSSERTVIQNECDWSPGNN